MTTYFIRLHYLLDNGKFKSGDVWSSITELSSEHRRISDII